VSGPAADGGAALLWYRELFAHSPIGLAILDAELRCLGLNDALASRIGIGSVDCEGKRLADLSPALGGLEPALLRLFEGSERTRELSVEPETGNPGWQVTAVRLDGSGGSAGVGLLVAEAQDSPASVAASRRMALLSRCSELFSVALDLEGTVAGLAEIFVPAFAEHLVVDLVESSGAFRRVLVHSADASASPGWTPVGDLVEYPPEHPSRRAVEERAPVVTDVSGEELERLSPTAESLRTSQRVGLRAAMAVPLLAGERVVGVVGLASSRAGRFAPDDVVVAVEIGHRAGSALEAARVYAAEREAHRLAEGQRVAAEAAVARLAVLHEITSGLSQARTVEEVAEVVMSRVATLLSADTATLIHVTPDGQQLAVIASVGLEEAVRQRFTAFPVDAALPASEVFRDGEAQWWPDLRQRDARFPSLAGIPARQQSMALLPLEVRERKLGVLTLGWLGEREVGEQERRLVQAIASQCAQALHRAALLESERSALAAAQDQRDRISLLAEVGRTLSSSLDYEENLARVVRLVIPWLADSCWVNLIDGDGLRAVAFAHADPDVERAMARLVELEGGYTGSATIREVARTGEARLLAELPEGYVEPAGRGDEQLELLRFIGNRSVAVVPLLVAGQSIGTMTLANGPSGRRLSQDDLELLAQMGRRAATAIEHARQFHQRAEVALTLQESLLPAESHEAEGLEIAHRYVPGTVGTEVGGDWFDVIPLSSGRTALVIGDVMGRGIRAAAVMGQVRAAVRAYAAMELPPDEVLAGLDRVVQGFAELQIVTAIYAIFDPGANLAVLANAGHPPPLLLGPEGERPRPLDLPVGTPLGVGGPPYTSVEVPLPPAGGLVLYTDGLIEERSRDIDVGIDLVCSGLTGVTESAEEMCLAALRAVNADEDFGDDVAVLVARVAPRRDPAAAWSRLPIGDDYADVATARRWAVEQLELRGLEALSDSVALVVSELVTNAMRYGSTPRSLQLRRGPHGVLIEVADADRSLPRLRQAALDDEGGRGLLLVDSIVSGWSIRPAGVGKVVWVELAL
jgi:GAF domain-containing protein/anti-sigma regulatory factor (Ser/Thr protein kinase)